MAVETANVLQAVGASFLFSLGPPPNGVPTPMSPGSGITSITRSGTGVYTVLLDQPVDDGQSVIQNVVSGGKGSVIIQGANPRALDVLLFDRGGGGPAAPADLDFRLAVYQVPPTP